MTVARYITRNTATRNINVVSGSNSFISLIDTPSGLSGNANKHVAVTSDETGLEFVDGSSIADLNDLTDVTLTGLTDGEILVSSSGVFINQTLTEANIMLRPQTGSSDPTGVVTPRYTGDIYLDTTSIVMYVAFGATSSDWQIVPIGFAV